MTRTVILLFLCLPLVAPRPLLKTFRVSQGDIKSSNRPTTTPTSRDPYVVVEEVEITPASHHVSLTYGIAINLLSLTLFFLIVLYLVKRCGFEKALDRLDGRSRKRKSVRFVKLEEAKVDCLVSIA